jgi:hypothetical protein
VEPAGLQAAEHSDRKTGLKSEITREQEGIK